MPGDGRNTAPSGRSRLTIAVWVTDSNDNQVYSSDPRILNKGG